MSSAVGAQTTTLKHGTTASPTGYVAIAEIISINGPGPNSDRIDVTSLDTVGSYREYVAGFKNPGEVSITANLLAAHLFDTSPSAETLVEMFDSQIEHSWQIDFPQTLLNVTATFDAYVGTYSITAAVGEKVTLNATLVVTGAVTWTAS